MRKPSNQGRPVAEPAEPGVVSTDDGGSGLYEACHARFAEPEYEIMCDPVHTVWVKRVADGRSVGLPPWLPRQCSLEAALERVESKLRVPVGER